MRVVMMFWSASAIGGHM